MTEHPAAWFVQNKVSQSFILCDKRALFPNRLSRRWRHATDDHISYLAFGVAGNNMHCLG